MSEPKVRRSEDRYDPQHIESLTPEVRAAVFRRCGTPRALYPFAHYADNLQRVVLAYEHFYCGTGGTLSGEMSCVVIDRDACGACFASQAYAL